MTRKEAIKILRKEIECLSHTKCEDCILEAGCNPIKTTPYDSEYIEVYEMAIKALEQEPKWIPVSERLPEEDDFYLVTAKVGNEFIIDISEYTPKNDSWDIPHEIVAWMPLPEPYKVEPQESDHKCHTCKHYTSGERDGSCGSYICKEYSNWESEG